MEQGAGVEGREVRRGADTAGDAAAQVKTDVFLSKVVEQVRASETVRWRGFYIAPNHTVCHLVDGAKKARICVPADCRGAVMMEAHGGSVLVGHPGMARTLASVPDSYYWPTMAADVEALVRSCRVCAGAKTSTQVADKRRLYRTW
jgi:hypothetical protein